VPETQNTSVNAPKIFLSHSAKEEPACTILYELYDGLVGAGYDVLVDRARLQEDTGAPWRDALGTWMELCDGAVVLLDERARDESLWVPYETAILSWRRTRDPRFRLVPICVDPVTPVSLTQSRLEPTDISALQALAITADAGARRERPDYVRATLEALAPLKEAASAETAIERIERLIESYLDVEDTLIVDAARELGEDLGRWDPKLTRRRALSRLLLSRGLPEAVRALRPLPLPKDRMRYVVELLATAWVDLRAVSDIRPIAYGAREGRAIAINTEEVQICDMYLLRASGAAPDHPWRCVELPTGLDEGGAEALIELIDEEFVRSLGGRIPAVQIRRFIRSPQAVDPDPIILIFTPPAPEADVLLALRREYPHFTFFCLSPEVPAGDLVPPVNARFLRPALSREKVAAATAGWLGAHVQLDLPL
jgi:hypothetical protein